MHRLLNTISTEEDSETLEKVKTEEIYNLN